MKCFCICVESTGITAEPRCVFCFDLSFCCLRASEDTTATPASRSSEAGGAFMTYLQTRLFSLFDLTTHLFCIIFNDDTPNFGWTLRGASCLKPESKHIRGTRRRLRRGGEPRFGRASDILSPLSVMVWDTCQSNEYAPDVLHMNFSLWWNDNFLNSHDTRGSEN